MIEFMLEWLRMTIIMFCSLAVAVCFDKWWITLIVGLVLLVLTEPEYMNIKSRVTKEQFHEYDRLLKSGLYKNMVDPEVAYVLGIDRRQHIYIMVHYEELKKKFGGA